MKKNTQVETAQKSQATDKNTGKVKTLKNTQERRKAREEQFRNFRINALRRRCKRMKFSEEKIEELVKKLIEQMNAPKEYDILIMFNPKDFAMLNEALAKVNIQYRYKGDTYMSIGGDQNVLAKIREIAPPGAKIFPYAKKMESVIPTIKEKSGYIAKNNDKSSTAKSRRLQRKADKLRKKQLDGMAVNDRKLHAELQKEKRMNNRRKIAKKIKMLHKRLQKAALKANKKKSSTTVQLASKKASEGSKTLKKAA